MTDSLSRKEAMDLLRAASWVLSDLGLVEAYWADDGAMHVEKDRLDELRDFASIVQGHVKVRPLLTDKQLRARCFICTVLHAVRD